MQRATTAASPGPLERWRWRDDRLVQLASVAALVLLALYLVPAVPPDTLVFLDEFVTVPSLLVLALVAMRLPPPRGPAGARWFWGLAAAAYASWLAFELAWILGAPGSGSLAIDGVYCLYYILLALAVEMRPHRGEAPLRGDPVRWLSIAGTLVFLFGMLAYFAVIPAQLDARAYGSLVPSYLMYIAMDLYLALRFAGLLLQASDRRWRAVYGLFACAGAAGLAADMLELLNQAGVVVVWRQSPWSLLWYPPFFLTILAARARLLPAESPPATDGVADRRRAAAAAPAPRPLVAYLIALPVIHLLVHALGLGQPASHLTRELLVLGLLAVLGGLAVAQQRLERRRQHELAEDLDHARAELQRARRLQAIGRLARAVAHDFNNLLTAIRGSLDLLRLETRDRARAASLCDTIDRATDHADSLTRQLMAFGRSQRLRPVVLDLNRIIEESRELLRPVLGPDVELVVRPGARHPQVRFDQTQIHGVLLNLATNARHAMPQGGRLVVSTSDLFDPERGADVVLLEVEDTGTGMDADTLERIFEPYFSTKPAGEGHGLGLATVYGLIEQSGGRIDVVSRPGEGTTFRIRLDREPAAGERADGTTGRPAPEGPERQRTVLVVDDEDGVRDVVTQFLVAGGYHVLTATNGQQALRVAAGHRGPIDLLLTDVRMPVMDGVALARRFAMERPDAAILFMSGHTGGQALAAARPGRPVPLLAKPFGMQGLLGAVREALPKNPDRDAYQDCMGTGAP